MRRWMIIAGLAMAAWRVTAQDVPVVSEQTRLRWENAMLKQQLALATAQLDLCRAQVAPEAYRNTLASIEREIQATRDTFEADNSGWTLDGAGQPVKKGGS